MIQLPSGDLIDITDIALITSTTTGTGKKAKKQAIMYLKGNCDALALSDEDMEFIRSQFQQPVMPGRPPEERGDENDPVA